MDSFELVAPATVSSTIERFSTAQTTLPPSNDDHHDLPLPPELAHLSPKEQRKLERRLVRKIDMRLVPTISLLFFLNIIDRNSIASAQIAGLSKSLEISNTQYNTAIMVFYLGYITTQLPSNLVLGKVRPSIYLPSVAMAWGTVTLCQGFLQGYGGLLATRIVLGVFMGPCFPGCSFLSSCWYKADELPQRMALMYAGHLLSCSFGGLIGAGILGKMEGVAGRDSWRWLFIIYGAVTMGVGAVAYFLFPDYPKTTKWLSAEERLFAEWRLQNEAAGIKDEDAHGAWWGVKESLKDVKMWLFMFMGMMLSTSGCFVQFLPIIMKQMLADTKWKGNNTITLLLTAPPYFIAFLGSVAVAYSTSKHGRRCLHLCLPLVVSLLGALLLTTVRRPFAVRYAAMYFLVFGVYAVYIVPIPWIASSIPRPRAKRAASMAIVNFMSGGVTYFYCSYLFPDSSAPMYRLGNGVIAGALACCILGGCGIWFHLRRENRKLDEEEKKKKKKNSEGGGRKGYRYIL